MKVEVFIKKAEEKWLQNIYEHIKELFRSTPLPSHDETHHFRVWNYAKQLTKEIHHSGIEINEVEIEALLLASLFHDTGLTITKEKDHGLASADIYRDYFRMKKAFPVLQDEIIFAIEKHDDKTYHEHHQLVEDTSLNLLTALGISDDLDAFGNLGIYRYLEIYLMRSIPFEDLGLKVRANLSGRFGHFEVNCKNYPDFFNIHRSRFKIAEDFFRKYVKEINKKEDLYENNNSGYLSIARQVYRENLKGTESLKEICLNILKKERDPFVIEFFKKVIDENEWLNS